MENKTIPQPTEVISLNVDSSKDMLADAFGISDERRDELCEIIEENFHNKKSGAGADLVAIASKTTNHNELAWASFTYGLYAGDPNPGNNPLQSLMDFMKS